MPPASASHPISMCLDIEPDRDGVTVGSDSTLQAFIGISDSDHPPDTECHLDGFEAGTDTQIDFEITGAGDQDGATPSTPDLSCEVMAGGNSCPITPPSSDSGDQQIQAWMDQDRDDGTVELDATEGYDENSMPGDVAEPDGTDVAFWTWQHTSCCGDRSYAVTISIERRREGRLGGMIESRSVRCKRYRLVNVRRVRPGADELVARTKSTSRGRWHTPQAFRRGRFYARIKSRSYTPSDGGWALCEGDRSDTIRVR